MTELNNPVEFRSQAYEVESQTPTLNEDSLAEARRLIGVDYRGARATIEITRDNIRDFCNYIGSDNPLFLDEDYARRTRWGGIIAPPFMVGMAIVAPGLRGIQWIHAGIDYDIYRVMRPGDVITQRGRLIDAQERQGRTVSRMILQTAEVTCTNQRDELVSVSRVYTMRTPRRQAQGGMQYQAMSHQWSPEELEALEAEMEAEEIRGSRPRYWEDVQEGEDMPAVVYGPLRVVDIAFTGSFTDAGAISAQGVAHTGGHFYQLLNRRRHPADTYVDPSTGFQDHPHRGHWERFMAREVGMPGVYDMGPHRHSWLCRYITDWMGDDAVLKKLGCFLRRPNVVGDVTRIKGRISKKWVEDSERLVEVEVWAENQRGEVTMPGHGVISLPSGR
jgi:acyl dehydratase